MEIKQSISHLAAIGMVILVSSIAAGCGDKRVDNGPEDAKRLYDESKALIITYTRQLKTVRDTAAMDSLAREMEDRLTRLNMTYPPGTDKYLSEGQNDTLYQLISRYVEIRNAHLGAPAPDSDSITPADDNAPAAFHNGNNQNGAAAPSGH